MTDLSTPPESSQDLTKKFVIVIASNVESWQLLNTVAHIAAYLGNKIKAPFESGRPFVTRDGQPHPRNSQFPIVVLSAKPGQLKNLIKAVRSSGLSYLGFIREMIETSDDNEIARIMSTKMDDDVEYLGIGIFGENEELNALTKKFSLWK